MKQYQRNIISVSVRDEKPSIFKSIIACSIPILLGLSFLVIIVLAVVEQKKDEATIERALDATEVFSVKNAIFYDNGEASCFRSVSCEEISHKVVEGSRLFNKRVDFGSFWLCVSPDYFASAYGYRAIDIHEMEKMVKDFPKTFTNLDTLWSGVPFKDNNRWQYFCLVNGQKVLGRTLKLINVPSPELASAKLTGIYDQTKNLGVATGDDPKNDSKNSFLIYAGLNPGGYAASRNEIEPAFLSGVGGKILFAPK